MPVKIANDCENISATEDAMNEFVADPLGYFLIRLKRESGEIELGFCSTPNVVSAVIVGKMPKELYDTIIRKKLVSRLEHAAYLGRELHRAYVALKLGIEYVQDAGLELEKS